MKQFGKKRKIEREKNKETFLELAISHFLKPF